MIMNPHPFTESPTKLRAGKPLPYQSQLIYEIRLSGLHLGVTLSGGGSAFYVRPLDSTSIIINKHPFCKTVRKV